jgi:hypothetical protein
MQHITFRQEAVFLTSLCQTYALRLADFRQGRVDLNDPFFKFQGVVITETDPTKLMSFLLIGGIELLLDFVEQQESAAFNSVDASRYIPEIIKSLTEFDKVFLQLTYALVQMIHQRTFGSNGSGGPDGNSILCFFEATRHNIRIENRLRARHDLSVLDPGKIFDEVERRSQRRDKFEADMERDNRWVED